MFAYCENNPVTRADPTGQWGLDTIVGAVVGAVVNVASYYISNGSNSTATGCIDAALSGAVSGALLTGTIGFRALGATAQGVYTAITTNGSLKQKLLCGAASGLAAFGLGSGAKYVGKTFVTAEEVVVGNAIVGTASGTLNDTFTRTTQYVVCGNNHNGNGTNHNRTANNRRPYGRGGREVELLLV